MTTFKDYIAADNSNVFFNDNEFADMHNINGKMLKCIIESENYQDRAKRQAALYEGISGKMIILHIEKKELGFSPKREQRMVIDNKYYLVENSSENLGVLEISLMENIT